MLTVEGRAFGRGVDGIRGFGLRAAVARSIMSGTSIRRGHRPAATDDLAYFGSFYEWPYAVSLASGALRWRGSAGIVGSPAAIGSDFIMPSAYGGLERWNASGARVWAYSAASPKGGVAVYGGQVYTASRGLVTAIDASTGASSWTYRFRNATSDEIRCENVPAVDASGAVYFADSKEPVAMAYSADGQLLWSVDIRSPAVSSIAIGSRSLVVATTGGLVKLSAAAP